VKTLVIPCVSTANVAQLAVDLLIASLSLRRVGVFDPGDLVPVVGARENGEEGVTSPLEMFGRDDSHIVFIQQRSPVLKSRKAEFIASLSAFIAESRFAAVLFLSGVDLSNRTDAQMWTPLYQITPADAPSLRSTPLANLHNLQIPAYTSPVSDQSLAVASEPIGIPFIPGGGLTRRILRSLPSSWPVPTAVLLQFVNEGDNRQDAVLFASAVAKILEIGLSPDDWKQPSSWSHGLFGPPHDQTLYG